MYKKSGEKLHLIQKSLKCKGMFLFLELEVGIGLVAPVPVFRLKQEWKNSQTEKI